MTKTRTWAMRFLGTTVTLCTCFPTAPLSPFSTAAAPHTHGAPRHCPPRHACTAPSPCMHCSSPCMHCTSGLVSLRLRLCYSQMPRKQRHNVCSSVRVERDVVRGMQWCGWGTVNGLVVHFEHCCPCTTASYTHHVYQGLLVGSLCLAFARSIGCVASASLT
jgi:hypothetical protein